MKEAAREAVGQVKAGVSSTASKLRESAEEMASQRRDQAGATVGRLGENLYDTARSMEEEDPNIAHYAHRVADRLDRVADYVRNRDLVALRDDAAVMARRHPVAFFGGLFVAGLVVGNLVKAGASAVSEDDDNYADDETSPSGTFAAGSAPGSGVGTPGAMPSST